jgi:hypothetical protein
MNCALSVLLPFACLAKRVSTKTELTEKGNSYTIELRKRRKDTNKVVFFFLSNYPTKVYTNFVQNRIAYCVSSIALKERRKLKKI